MPPHPAPPGPAAPARFSPAPGVSLRWAALPAAAPRRASLVLLHGRSEFLEKYAEVLADLTSRGFDVYTVEWRGQGGSTRALPNPHKGHVADFDNYLVDLHAFVTRHVPPDPPRVLLAHSMGGHLGLRYLHAHPAAFRCAAFSAPMVDIRFPPLLAAPVTAAARLLTALGQGHRYLAGGDFGPRQRRFPGNPLTSDPARFHRTLAALDADPALRLGAPTAAWLAAARRSIAHLAAPATARAITTPVLLVAGSADRVVDTPAARRLAAAVPRGRFVLVPGARHELLFERDPLRARFWAAFDDFVRDQL